MSVELTTTPRNYTSLAELARLASITITNNSEALRQLDRAEEAIDDYIGFQEKAVPVTCQGAVSSAVGKVVVDNSGSSQLHQTSGYFVHCVIEIIAGTGAGQLRYIADSNYDNYSVTVADAWDTQPDTTSFFRIYQMGKFPRSCDTYSRNDRQQFYQAIPDALKKAVAAQIQFMIAKGDAYFTGDSTDIQSESIGNYSYSRGQGASGAAPVVAQLSPRTRALLVQLKNSGGQLVADNPTTL